LTPNKLAIPTINVKISTNSVKGEFLKRYFLFKQYKQSHKTAINSTIILKAIFFPVIKGNTIEGEIYREMKGSKNIGAFIPHK
jgi:hypothetical protein